VPPALSRRFADDDESVDVCVDRAFTSPRWWREIWSTTSDSSRLPPPRALAQGLRL